ncbi:2-oxoacid:ferredoxin oxidoreductase subunit beta [bacterium]|nr:2-oxoacid:ferredoxin oxidoreductase subunit beta [bacterium]
MDQYRPYLRLNRFPHIWCAGCGDGIALKSMLRAIAKIGWQNDEIVLVSGIGCSSRTPGYVDFNTLHTTHGRAIPFATGVKLANPKLHVIVVSGDGDALAIGGNHFIHAARRNIDLTVLIFNNHIYGMTGGQVSPATPLGKRASTAPYGAIDPPFNIVEVAKGVGATYVARGTAYHVPALDKLILNAFEKKGFAVVEIMSPCPTSYGRYNKLGTPVNMLQQLKDQAVPIKKWETMTNEERQGKFPIGLFLDQDRPEYCDAYHQLSERLSQAS